MGAITLEAVVSHPVDRERRWTGEFLIDTGAIDCLIPRRQLEAMGVEAHDRRPYVLADGSEVVLEVGGVLLEVMGGTTHIDVIFADDDAQPLLGARAMESLGVEIDVRNHRLRRLPAVSLR